MNSESPIRKIKTSGKDSYQLIISSKKIANVLREYHIVNSKTYSYTLPDIPIEYFNSFIAGYIEGDGCITISNNGIGCEYLCASFVGTKEFIVECSNLIPIKGKVRKHSSSNIYEIRWNGEKAIKFCDWVYSCKYLYHSYKYNNYLVAKDNFKNTKKERYKNIKRKVLNDLKDGGITSIKDYAKKIKIPFQTIYNWRNKWEKEGLL